MIFITLSISMPSRAKRHPSPRARQEASGTKLFSIRSPCKCLNKLILNSLHKHSGGGNRENPSTAFGWRAPAPNPWGCSDGGLPDTRLHPQPPAQRSDAAGGFAKVTPRWGWDVPRPPTATCPATDGRCGSSLPRWVVPFPADGWFSLTSRQAEQQRN